MTKAVFTTRVEPSYDDLPEERYHFPRTYLRQAEAAVGDWIVYYEPRRSGGVPEAASGRQAYFAAARVMRIERDAAREDHFYAFVTDYLEFDRPVPFREGETYYESLLHREDGATNKGAFGRAVRALPDREYDMILRAGFAPILGRDGGKAPATPYTEIAGFSEEQAPVDRPIVERLVARPFRDAAFATGVKTAYDGTCAVTGLRIVNGGGRSEVQAAHIRPVAAGGPDSLRNGIALSATVHWMFDRGLLSIDEDYSILIARDRVPEPVQCLLLPDNRIRLPAHPPLRPHAVFTHYHRENVFKG